jgi:hypothetical protein
MVLGELQCRDADGGQGSADQLLRGLIRVSGSKPQLQAFWAIAGPLRPSARLASPPDWAARRSRGRPSGTSGPLARAVSRFDP